MRICIIGNSHIAARKAAIRSGEVSLTGVDVAFWGLNRGRFFGTTLRDGRLVSRFPEVALLVSEGAYETLPVLEFDAIVFEGTRLPISTWVGDIAAVGCSASFSPAFLRAAAVDVLESCPVFQVARETASYRSGNAVYLSPAPIRAEGKVPTKPSKFELPTYNYLNNIIFDILSSEQIIYLQQPIFTLTSSGYTKSEYSKGAVRLVAQDEVLGDEELFHMNGHYGAVLWRALLDKLSSPQEP